MILVVVLVHSIAANKEEVLKSIHVANDLIEAIVGSEVGGISLRYAKDTGIANLVRVEDPDLCNFSNCELRDLFVRLVPNRVSVIAKIFKPNPSLGWIRN